MDDNKNRIYFDLTDEALGQLNELQTRAGVSTKGEVVRNALCLYEWHLYHKAQGNHLVIMEIPDECPPV